MAPKRAGGGSVEQRKNKLLYALIASLFIIVFVGVLFLLKGVYQTETYYTLNADVPTRTQVSADMLSPVTTSQGTAPVNALSISDIQAGGVFTKFPLNSGDILTKSNSGALDDIATGVPDTWVVTSFGVSADNAVGGRIRRGDYADMMVANAKGAFYPFVNILVLDTSVSLSNASSSNAVNTQEAKAGQTSQYTVAGTPGDMAKLQQVIKSNSADIKLVLSPRQNQYNPPALASYSDSGKMFTFNISDGPANLGKDTDSTFTAPKRDAFGRPVNTTKSCSSGNGVVTDPKVCAALKSSQSGTTSDATPAPSASPTK